MAKGYRPKAASYFFKEKTPGQSWEVSKFLGKGGGDESSPSDVYTIRLEGSRQGILLCDCPASFRGYKGGKQECKHVTWLRRWIKLKQEGKLDEAVAYYDSTDDKFHRAAGLLIC